jgi:hypothetical protein
MPSTAAPDHLFSSILFQQSLKSLKLEELLLQSFNSNISSFIKGLNHFGLFPSSQHHSLKVSWHLATFIDSHLKPCSTSHHITSSTFSKHASHHHQPSACSYGLEAFMVIHLPFFTAASLTFARNKTKTKQKTLFILRSSPKFSTAASDTVGDGHNGKPCWRWVSGHRHHTFGLWSHTWCGRTDHQCMWPTIVIHIGAGGQSIIA